MATLLGNARGNDDMRIDHAREVRSYNHAHDGQRPVEGIHDKEPAGYLVGFEWPPDSSDI